MDSNSTSSQPNGDDTTTSRSQTDTNRYNHRSSSALESSNFIGKHRLAAIISQQIQIMQCTYRLISSVELRADALLPVYEFVLFLIVFVDLITKY
ncbi:hypothetical protein QVD17_40623 [Tagetes erecta]|uniref:Uncharacterized protein n=1 Tax=Tagetes erecta TaxID=13708 RepID=A0AAD8JW51_TARER|nr:hypothetical protein QVD17_40623 [Tagetes erecta]